MFAKEFAAHGGAWRMLAAVCLVAAGNLCWQFMLRTGMEISRGGLLFAVGVAVGVVVIGAVGYHETITWHRALGGALAVVAIALLVA